MLPARFDTVDEAVRAGLKKIGKGLLAASKPLAAVGAVAVGGPLGGGQIGGFQVRDFNADFVAALRLPCLSTVGRLVCLRALWRIRRDFAEAAVRAAVAVAGGRVRPISGSNDEEGPLDSEWSVGGIRVRRAVAPIERWGAVRHLLLEARGELRKSSRAADPEEQDDSRSSEWQGLGVASRCGSYNGSSGAQAKALIARAADLVSGALQDWPAADAHRMLDAVRNGQYLTCESVPFLAATVSIGAASRYLVTVPRASIPGELDGLKFNLLPTMQAASDPAAMDVGHPGAKHANAEALSAAAAGRDVIGQIDDAATPFSKVEIAERLTVLASDEKNDRLDSLAGDYVSLAKLVLGEHVAARFAPTVPVLA